MIEVVVQTNNFAHLGASLGDAVDSALDHGVITLIEVATPLTPVDTGMLRGNVVITRGEGEREVVWVMPYAIYQNFGGYGRNGGGKAYLFANQGADAAEGAINAALADWPNSGGGGAALDSFMGGNW